MNTNEIRKAMELLVDATNELNPTYFNGQEVVDIYEELPRLVELYRYLEGIMGDEA